MPPLADVAPDVSFVFALSGFKADPLNRFPVPRKVPKLEVEYAVDAPAPAFPSAEAGMLALAFDPRFLGADARRFPAKGGVKMFNDFSAATVPESRMVRVPCANARPEIVPRPSSMPTSANLE